MPGTGGFITGDQVYPEMLTWPERLTLYRTRLGLTKANLSDICSYLGTPVTRTTLWRIETGMVQPSPQSKKSIEAALVWASSFPDREVDDGARTGEALDLLAPRS